MVWGQLRPKIYDSTTKFESFLYAIFMFLYLSGDDIKNLLEYTVKALMRKGPIRPGTAGLCTVR